MKMVTKILLLFLFLFLIVRQSVVQQDGRYLLHYPEEFFDAGIREIEFNPSVHDRIGILVQNHSDLPLHEIADMMFGASPFDRHSRYFYFRIEDEFRQDMANNNVISTKAHDYSGSPIEGGLPISEGQGAFNLIFLRFGIREVV